MKNIELIRFMGFTLIAFILLKLPIIGKYLAIINTLIHEVGHALAAILTFGKIEKINLFTNAAGEAWSSSRTWFGGIITNLAGYLAASATAYLFLCFMKMNKYMEILYVLIGIFTFSLIFWIRNVYGVLWTTTFLGLVYFTIKTNNHLLIQNILMLIISIIYVEAFLASLEIFRISFVDYKNSGDAYNLAKKTLILPAPIWGTFFLLQALFFSYKGICLFM